METFVTVIVVLATIAFGVLLIHLLNPQHSERIAAFHYSRSGMPVPGPAAATRRKAHAWARASGARASGTAGRRNRRDDGPHRPGRPILRRRPN
ncbi:MULTISPECIES: hypothetical protein [unclassified Streptomyces]|uniref:hypothetical protein n=1 Tax=unclassified Streptomyces TaxID=2593676 RepID=UPI0004CA75EB|nr:MULTISPECIES: hypothetical protein [unclassified Streptomyces]